MRTFIYASDLLGMFPHRRKSWAYDFLRKARGPGPAGRPAARGGRAAVREVAALMRMGEPELRKCLGGSFAEAA
jgi:hypothetical protein